MEQKLPEVASNIFIPCKKCEADRYHKVLAHASETSAKVECEVCKKKSTYKLPKPKKPKAVNARKSKSAQPAGPTWESLKGEIGTDDVSSYSMDKRFEDRAAINHPKFGLGFVILSTPYKIEVVFEEGPKALIHNKSL